MQGFKKADLAIFQRGLVWPCLVDTGLLQDFKNDFYEFLPRLLYVSTLKNNSVKQASSKSGPARPQGPCGGEPTGGHYYGHYA